MNKEFFGVDPYEQYERDMAISEELTSKITGSVVDYLERELAATPQHILVELLHAWNRKTLHWPNEKYSRIDVTLWIQSLKYDRKSGRLEYAGSND